MTQKLWRCVQALVLLVLAAGVSLSAPAQPVSPAELIQVPVADRSAKARDAALRQALDIAVVRLAGERGLGEFWIAPGAVLTSYQYRRVFDGQTAENLALDVRFDVPALRQAIADAGLPVWNQPRPEVLLWLHGQEDWLDSVATAAAFPEVIESSQAWGYSLRFPQLDLRERRLVRVNDLQAGFQAPWLEHSAQYAMPLTLALSLELSDSAVPAQTGPTAAPDAGAPGVPVPQYHSTWWLAAGDQLLDELRLAPLPLAEALNQAWTRFNGQILEYQLFLRQSVPTQMWTIELQGLEQASDYLQALHELRELDAQPQVQSLSPGTVVFSIHWRGPIEQLQRLARQWGWQYRAPPTPTPAPFEAGTGLQSYGLASAPLQRQVFELVPR